MKKGENTDNEKASGCERERSPIRSHELLPQIIQEITQNYQDSECFNHLGTAVLPSREAVQVIIEKLKEIIFPGYFGHQELNRSNLIYRTGTVINQIFEKLSPQISHSIVHECHLSHQRCSFCLERGQEESTRFLKKIPSLRAMLAQDVRAAYDGDPAAKSFDEIIFSYPGILAIVVYRMAHELYLQEIPLLPRIMTEYAHSITGIDIHPGAKIGESFFIDHGTGVVIGETTIIGNRVKIYQGVTLGAANFPRDAQGNLIRGMKRHPTIEDDVTIYSGATILDGRTVIGARSVIGGNVWITESVPPDTIVVNEKPDLIYKGR